MLPDQIACPVCDAVYHLPPQMALARTRCRRCGFLLSLGKTEAIARVVGLAATSVVLMGLVLYLPFLDLRAGPFDSEATVLDAVMGFSTGIMVPLSIAVLGFIIVLPLTRFLLLIYALLPLLLGWRNAPGARHALRWAIKLKPWAMAEIFMIGVAVALVKLLDLASVSTGPAFWAFAGLIALAALQDMFMCRNTLWVSLNNNR